MDDAAGKLATKGGETLLEAIAMLPAGIQVSMIVMIAFCTAVSALCIYLLRELRRERQMSREDGIAQRDVQEKTAVAMALIAAKIK